jgi:hypothetical protein
MTNNKPKQKCRYKMSIQFYQNGINIINENLTRNNWTLDQLLKSCLRIKQTETEHWIPIPMHQTKDKWVKMKKQMFNSLTELGFRETKNVGISIDTAITIILAMIHTSK